MTFRRLAAVVAPLLIAASAASAAPRAQDDTGVRLLLDQVEQAVRGGDPAAYLALLGPGASTTRALAFTNTEILPGAARAVVQERDRQPLAGAPAGAGYRLVVDAFADFGGRARIATWRLDVRQAGEGGVRAWKIADEDVISSVENIYRLSLNPTRQFAAHDLKIAVEDLDLTLSDGSLFVADVDLGVTAVVLLGRGTMSFHPAPDTEKGQVKIFCGSETLTSPFDAAFVRLNPSDFDHLIAASSLSAVPVDPRELRRAQDVFEVESPKSFAIDLGDLSRDEWSLLPTPGDVLAEIRTRRYDTLTYAKASAEAEDITLFDRKHKHNIALYASRDRLASRGRFYNEDDLEDFDVLDYTVDIASTPDRLWIDGRALMHLKVRAESLGTLTLRLADPLVVSSIVSDRFGRLFPMRVKNQNTVVVNLPSLLTRGTELALMVAYAGRLQPQTPDRETIGPVQDPGAPPIPDDFSFVPANEPSFLYSSRSYWYPQATVTDYATALIRISVPAAFEVVASGELQPGFPEQQPAGDPAQSRKVFVFKASRPLRYLAFVVSRFVSAETLTVVFPDAPAAGTDGAPAEAASNRSLRLSIETNPRDVQRGHTLAQRAADIALFYRSVIGDSPYPTFTVALVENDLPGGHSPAYFAALNQPARASTPTWRNDPAAFPGYPEFFLAHEMAHQWWGQAVGWENYHEQWLSEGFAQYFAALYAQHYRGPDTFASVLNVMRRWATDDSDQGPVYLGYRLGHIKNDSRVFRALVYNKGALVLHMLRLLVGDEAFFNGLRRFYWAERFHKTGTDELRKAMEAEAHRPLDRFFERWIYGDALPKLKWSYRVEGSDLVLHVEQTTHDLFEMPLPVTLQYADARPVEVVVPVTERSADLRVPLAGTLRGVDVDRDGILGEVSSGR